MNLLGKIANLIGAGHRDSVKAILSTLKKRGELKNPRDIETEAKALIKLVRDNQQVFKPRQAEPLAKISSADHNHNMKSVFMDLNAIYKQTEYVGGVQEKQKATVIDEFVKARAAVLKLINDARVYSLRNRHPEYDDIKLVNFNISANKSTSVPTALVDADSRLLKLPMIANRRAHLPIRNSRTTRITAETFGGQTGQLGKQFNPYRAVDTKAETFWAEVIYSDVAVQTQYQRWGPNQSGEMVEFINGPYTVLTLSYNAAEPINQVKLFPFSNHPVKIIEVTYKPNASSKIRYQVQGFRVEESLDWIEYNFETVMATDIQVVLAQENYRTLNIKVPKSVLYATDLLLRVQEDRYKEIQETPDLLNIGIEGNYSIYNDALKDLSELMNSKDLLKSPTTEIDLAGKIIMSIGESMAVFNPELKDLLEDVSSYTSTLPKDLGSEIEKISKYEYVIGAREIETNYVVYSPVGYYESERFEPKATIVNVELEVDERHPLFRTQYGDIQKTSTEWEIEFAPDRRLPIYPSNLEDNGFLRVSGERLFIDPYTNFGYTRFPAAMSFASIRANDDLLIAGTDYTVVWDTTYEGRLQINISSSAFDTNRIYTIDYYAHPSSMSIDVLSKFTDKAIAVPDVFKGTTNNNSINLTTFPFVNFKIINSDDFVFSDNYNGYQYVAPSGAYTTGLIKIYPEWVNHNGELLTGIVGSTSGVAVSGYSIDWGVLSPSYLEDPYGYQLSIPAVNGAVYTIEEIVNSGLITLSEIPRLYTGLVGNEIALTNFSGNFTGTPPSGYIQVPYSIDIVYIAGDITYSTNSAVYEPLVVTVGGKKAKNITSYQSSEQPAFNVSQTIDGEYEFIHDGRTLYFNQSTSAEIRAMYRWMTQYVKVNAVLRANKPISPTVTPQVNEYRLLINTMVT